MVERWKDLKGAAERLLLLLPLLALAAAGARDGCAAAGAAPLAAAAAADGRRAPSPAGRLGDEYDGVIVAFPEINK